MNRFTAMGLAFDAIVHDRRIIVLTSGSESISDVVAGFESITELTSQPGFRAHHRNGEQGIELASGGRIDVRSVRSNLRGLSADVVFIDDVAVHKLMPTQLSALHDDIERVIAGSPHAEVVPVRRSRHVEAG